jgi:hypothetical protein
MKCRECAAQATVHVTEVQEGRPRALHLCKAHAREHLRQDDLLRDRPCDIDIIARPWVEFSTVRVELLADDVCTADGEPVPRNELGSFLRRKHEEGGPLRVDLVASGLPRVQDFLALANDLGVCINSVTTVAERP